MTKKDLVALGLSDGAADVALQCIIAGYKTGARPTPEWVADCFQTLYRTPDHQLFQGANIAPFIDYVKKERAEEAAYVPKEPIQYKSWAPDVEEGALDQIRNSCELPMAVHAALMPDVHQGYGLPVGGVLATEGAVIPYGVGVDIACRMKLTVLDLSAKFLEPEQVFSKKGDQLADVIEKSTRFGMGASWQKRQSHPVMDADWSITDITKNLKDRAWNQLGTSGTGNHFVEFGLLTVIEATTDAGFRLEPGTYVALLSHSGSRGPGAEICKFYTGVAQSRLPARFAEKFKHLAWLDMATEAGQEYWKAMNLMGEYASANHSVIHENVADELGVDVLGSVENHHNFCIPGDELVQTTRGPVRMADLQPHHDYVYAHDNGRLVPTVVTAKYATGRKLIYSIKTAHRSLRCSPAHPVLVQRNGLMQWVVAKEIVIGDNLVCGHGFYETTENVPCDISRFIGAYLGDGWLRSNPKRQGYSFGLAIGNASQSHTQRYAGLMTDLKLPEVKKQTWKNKTLELHIDAPGAYGITGSHKAFYSLIVEWGVGVESTNRRVPTSFFRSSEASKLALLSGYFDADGSIGDKLTRDGSGLIRACNEGLVQDLREIALSISMDCTPVRRRTRVTNYGPCVVYQCNVSPASMKRLDLWHSDRAAIVASATPRMWNKTAPTFMESVQTILIGGEEDVFDITVEHDSHSFLCSGVVVHNCWEEEHFGKKVYVHRKGATPAGKGVLGVIPGSMASPCFVVRGLGNPDSLMSASHGAGRCMSRNKAKQTLNHNEWKGRLRQQGVRVLSAGVDEVPAVYKDIMVVMGQQTDLVETIARFDPKIVKMADDGKSED